jgi:hypothetical protein
MKLTELLSGRADFESKTEITQYVRNSKNFSPATEDPSKAEALLIFSTSKQHTWLVSTSERLYCILDDLRKDRPHINWSMPRSRLFDGKKFIANIRTREKNEVTGLLDVTESHQDWLYTKRLFSEVPLEKRVRDLLTSTMSR